MNLSQAKKMMVMLILLLGGLLEGCGDGSSGYTMQPPYRSDIKTVAVPIWVRGKDVYRRELEFRLTESIVKQIELCTPYKVTCREKADTLLEGTIDLVSQRVTSFDPNTGQPREKEILMTVSFTWTDLRTGEVLAKRTKYVITSNYIPPLPFNEDFFEGSEDAINRLARRVVEQMEEDWGND